MSQKSLDETLDPFDALEMTILTDRVFEERIKILQAKLSKCIEQRNSFIDNYFSAVRFPHQERRETIEDCDNELEKIGKSSDP